MANYTTPTIDTYTVKEVLNKVINTDADALKVDIDNVTLKTEGSDINIEVHTDKAEDSMLMFSHTVASGSGGTSLVPLVDSAGHLQVDVLTTPATDSIYVDDADWTDGTSKHTLVGGLYQSTPQSITDGDVGPFQVDVNGRLGVALSPTDNAVLDAMVVDLAAIEVLLTAANVDHAANEVLLTGIDADTDAIKTDMAAIEVLLTGIDADTDAIKTDAAAIEVLLTAANVDHAANEALLTTIDADTGAIKTAVELIDDAVATLGTTTYSETSTKGLTVGVVRNDTLAALAGTDNEVAPLQVDKTGALYTVEETGQLGAIFEDGTTAVSSKQVVAIQFLEDTTFTTLTPADSSFIGTASGNGDNIDTSNTFPQGMTIFGRWTAFTLASGSIVAYQGAW